MSMFSHSLTKNITSHGMENFFTLFTLSVAYMKDDYTTNSDHLTWNVHRSERVKKM